MYKGDLAQGIDKIGKLAELMGTLRGVPRLAAIKAQTPILRAVQEEFVKGQDPYGRPWRPCGPQRWRYTARHHYLDSRSRGRHRRVSARWAEKRTSDYPWASLRLFSPSRVSARPIEGSGPSSITSARYAERWREITVQAVKDAIAEIRRAP